MEGIARQPEASGDLRMNMIIAAALVEGVALIAIMIVSAPESLKNIAGQCGIRPIKLTAIQNVQYQVAQQKHTLYWNWHKLWGGNVR
jgi:predicted glycosyltransferase